MSDDLDMGTLAQAIRKLPQPPCATCWAVAACESECSQFKAYVATGHRFAPPPRPKERF